MKFPPLSLSGIWWHSGRLTTIQTSEQNCNGGLHVGTFDQARDRYEKGRHYHAFHIDPNAVVRRSRDIYLGWNHLADKLRPKGVQIIAYINRHEGIGDTTIHDDYRSYVIDQFTDSKFLKHAPKATWSLLVIDTSVLQRVTPEERHAVLLAEQARVAAHKRRKDRENRVKIPKKIMINGVSVKI